MKEEIAASNCLKNVLGIQVGAWPNIYRRTVRIFIFKIFILPARERGRLCQEDHLKEKTINVFEKWKVSCFLMGLFWLLPIDDLLYCLDIRLHECNTKARGLGVL